MLNRRTLFALLPAAPLAATVPAPKPPLPPLELRPLYTGMPIYEWASAVNSNMRTMQSALKALADAEA